MKNVEMEGALNRALSQAPTLDFEALVATPVEKMSEHDFITMPRKKNRCRNIKRASVVAASFLVGAVVYGGWFTQFRMIDSIIALDVNQSVEITINRQNKVLAVRPLNKTGETVLQGKDFTQTDLHESVNVIVTEMIESGYLNESDKTILVSVENKDPEKANDLAATVNQNIVQTAEVGNVTPTILNQTYEETDEAAKNLAEEYGISTGKMNVVKVINEADESLSVESLSAMSMDQLIAVSEEKAIDLSKVITVDESQGDKSKNSANKTEVIEEEDAEVIVTGEEQSEDDTQKADETLDEETIESEETVTEEAGEAESESVESVQTEQNKKDEETSESFISDETDDQKEDPLETEQNSKNKQSLDEEVIEKLPDEEDLEPEESLPEDNVSEEESEALEEIPEV